MQYGKLNREQRKNSDQGYNKFYSIAKRDHGSVAYAVGISKSVPSFSRDCVLNFL